MDHAQAGFCIDGNFPGDAATAFRAGVTDWNSAFSVPGGAPLVENCASQQVGFRPGNQPGYPAYPCPGRPACTTWNRLYARGGYYENWDEIWLDRNLFWAGTGYRAAANHELGHVFGLDEQYLDNPEPGPGCATANPNTDSVMDAFTNGGPCPGTSATVTQLDKDRAKDFYTIRPASNPWVVNVSYQIFRYYFDDRNYTESNYQEKVQRWNGSAWVFHAEQNDNGVAFAQCDDHQMCVHNDLFAVAASGYFRVCLVPHNGVFGPRPETCTAAIYSP